MPLAARSQGMPWLSGSFRMSYMTNFEDIGSAAMEVMMRFQYCSHTACPWFTRVGSSFRWLSMST